MAARAPSLQTPPYITSADETSRWRQEYVYYRDERKEKKRSPTKTVYVAAACKTQESSSVEKTITYTHASCCCFFLSYSGATAAHVAAAAGDLITLKEEAARNPAVINQADENGWKPIHEVRVLSFSEPVCLLVPTYWRLLRRTE